MNGKSKGYSRKKMPYYTKKTKRSNKKTPSKDFNAKVKSVIHKMAENKLAAPQIIRNTRITNTLSDNILQVIPLMPNLAQGAGQGERVGNTVSTRRAMLYFSAHLFQISSASNADPPKYLDIYIYKYKRSNNQDAIILNNFLQYGNTSIPYDSANVPESGALDVNKDKFTLKRHIRKLLWNPRVDNTYAQATRHLLNACAFKIDITKYIKKDLLYDDDVSNLVSNDNLYLSCVYTNNDDTVYTPDVVVGEYDVSFTYEYEDL